MSPVDLSIANVTANDHSRVGITVYRTSVDGDRVAVDGVLGSGFLNASRHVDSSPRAYEVSRPAGFANLEVKVYKTDCPVPVGNITGGMPLQVEKTPIRFYWIAHWHAFGKRRFAPFVSVSPERLSSFQIEGGDSVGERVKSPSGVSDPVADEGSKISGVKSGSSVMFNRMTLKLGPERRTWILDIVAYKQVTSTGKDLRP